MNHIQYTFVLVFFFNIGCLVSRTLVPATPEKTWWKLQGETFRILALNKWSFVSVNSNGLLVVPEEDSTLSMLKVCYFQMCKDNKTHICLVNPQSGKAGWDQLHNITIAKQGTGEYLDFKPLQIEEFQKYHSDYLVHLQIEEHYVKVEETKEAEQYRLSKNQERSTFLIKK